ALAAGGEQFVAALDDLDEVAGRGRRNGRLPQPQMRPLRGQDDRREPAIGAGKPAQPAEGIGIRRSRGLLDFDDALVRDGGQPARPAALIESLVSAPDMSSAAASKPSLRVTAEGSMPGAGR